MPFGAKNTTGDDPFVEVTSSGQQHYMELFPERAPPKFWDTIAVDFDGVLNSYETRVRKNQTHLLPDPPVEGALEWVLEMVKHFNVIIFSARCSGPGGKEAIEDWLEKWGFPSLPVTNIKPVARMYLDDRAERFTGKNFPSVLTVRAFKPWNRVPHEPDDEPEEEVKEWHKK